MVYISTSCVNETSLNKCLRLLVDAGIRNIELSGGMVYQEDMLNVLLDFKRQYMLNYQLHNYFPPAPKPFVLNITSNVRASRQQSLNFIRRSIEMCGALGIDRYMVHAGYLSELTPPISGDRFVLASANKTTKQKAWDLMLDSLTKMNAWGKHEGIKIGLENLFPFGDDNRSLLTHYNDIRRYLEMIEGQCNVGLLLDLGHIAIAASHFGFDKKTVVDMLFESYPHKLLGVHLSENDGINDLHLPLEKGSWQLEITKRIKELYVPITLESRNLDKGSIISQYKLIRSRMDEE